MPNNCIDPSSDQPEPGRGQDDYEGHREELEFVKAVACGLMEVRKGKNKDIEEVKKRLVRCNAFVRHYLFDRLPHKPKQCFQI